LNNASSKIEGLTHQLPSREEEEKLSEASQRMAGKEFVDPLCSVGNLDYVMRTANTYLNKRSQSHELRNLFKTFDVFGRMQSMFAEAEAESIVGDGEMVNVAMGHDLQNAI